jgi:hypothetical protein
MCSAFEVRLMVSPTPLEVVQQYRFIIPPRRDLWAISRDAKASVTFLAVLDWMTSIVWPFAYDEPFPLASSEAPEQIEGLVSKLRTLGSNYEVRDTIPSPLSPGTRVQQSADLLGQNLQRWLAFENWAEEQVLLEDVDPNFRNWNVLRLERFQFLGSMRSSESFRVSGVDVVARLLRVNVERAREQFWVITEPSFPSEPERWATLLVE